MTPHSLPAEWQPDAPWRAPVSSRERQLARLDLFIHRRPGMYMAGLMVLKICGAGLLGTSIVLAAKDYPTLTCALAWATGAGVLSLLILILTWRGRREYGRPASVDIVAALRLLIPTSRWEAVARKAAAHRRHSPRRPATLAEILMWLDLAVIAEKQALPRTIEEAAVLRCQERAFG